MPLVLRPPGEVELLTDRLARLGRSRRFARTAAGVFRLAAMLLLGVGVFAFADAAFHLPAAVRTLALGGLLAVGGFLYARGVRRPLNESTDPVAVAHLAEAEFPPFNDALASAAAFLTDPDCPGSLRFRRVAVIRAERIAEKFDLDTLVPAGAAWRAVFGLFAAAAVFAPLAIYDRAAASLAVVRLFDPFGSHPWPPKTAIALLAPDAGLKLHAKGEPLDVRFAVRGLVPPNATVEVRAGGAVAVESVSLDPDAPNVEAGLTLDPSRTARDFEFRVVANDAATEWRPIRVAPPPRLVPLEGRPSPQVRLAFPEYTRLPPLQLPDGAGIVEGVTGTRVALRAAADRRIVAARLVNQNDPAALAPLYAVAPLGGLTTPFAAAAADPLAAGFAADIPVAVTGPEGRVLEVEFAPPLPGLYALRFTDEDGLTGTRLFDVRTFPDPSPTVTLERPAAGTDPLGVLPTGKVVVRARAEDRVFAACRLVLEYRVNDGPSREISLADAAIVPVVASAIARPQPLFIAATRTISVAAFTKPDGTPPGDGDAITLRAVATDWDDRTLAKSPGRSAEITLRVYAPASLDALIQKDLAALRPEVVRIRDQQKDAADALKDVAKGVQPSGKLSADDREKLTRVEQAQRQLQAKLADPQAGVRAKADMLRDLVRGNDLPKSPVTERAEAVAKALGKADEEHLPNVAPLAAQAKQAAEQPNPDPKAVKDPLAAAAKHQQAALDGINNALEKLEKWAGAGELRGDVRGLKDQVAKAGKDAAAAAEKVPGGKAAEQLTPAERSALAPAADKFAQSAEEAAGLMAKAGRVADEKSEQAAAAKAVAAAKAAAAAKATGTPAGEALKAEAAAAEAAAAKAEAEAAALREAVAQAGGEQVANDLRKAADAARNNRPGQADQARASAADRLQKMQDRLTESPPAADELAKKTKANADAVEKLAAEQDELRKKVKQADATPDPAEKAEKLQALAAEQEKLERRAEELARKLNREGAEPAAEELKRAAEKMAENRTQMEQGATPPEKQQDEALDRIDDALDKLDTEREKKEESLDREKREDLAKALQALAARQTAAVAEADRIQAAAVAAKRWERPLLASLSALADQEKILAAEVRDFAGKKLTELKVFDRMARQAADQMDRAAARAHERKDDALQADPALFDAESEAAAAEIVRRPMETARRRLQQVIDSVKPDDKKAAAKPPGDGGGGGGGGGEPGGGAPGLPPIAQLKALRDWQAEVNAGTAAFAKAHPDPAKITDDEKADLRELEQAQKDIAELFEQLLPLFQKGADIP